ncbi:MAG: bifunctional 3,4-dihydroxy-2-butanone-4-phosphate synthase/GTP cyclohydrolase II [Actinomycetia bacterium]|nr:bifunctional 3,4-dihydroxy-2-butanone-4-phosphate synthase/GTP cyclohydrolase II [Actinomycetes bacterium]
MTLNTIREAVDALKAGDFVLVVDNENRENEGDLIIAAEAATEAKIAFMVRHTSGLICLSTTGERLDELDLPLMVIDNTEAHKTAFTVSIDYKIGTTTGISAADRAATIRAVADPRSASSDFSRPGHVFPLRYHVGGVLERQGHTEATVDLTRLADMFPAGVLCEIVNDDGTMRKGEELERFAKEHDLVMISIDDLVAYRWRTEVLVTREATATLPTKFGDFDLIGYRSHTDHSPHIALTMGDIAGKDDVLTRVHSVCLTGDVFGSLRCDCGAQLDESMRLIAQEGEGCIVYNAAHEGRGIGILAKIAAYDLQEQGLDTVDANRQIGHADDARHYGVDAQIIHDLGIRSVRLMTNNPDKVDQLERYGVTVMAREPIWVGETAENRSYLDTKTTRMGHIIEGDSYADR